MKTKKMVEKFVLLMMSLIFFETLNYHLYLTIILFVVLFLYKGRIRINNEAILLILTFGAYFLFYMLNGAEFSVNNAVAYLLGPIMFYLLGYNFSSILGSNRLQMEEYTIKLVSAICIFSTLFALFCIIYKNENLGLYYSKFDVQNLAHSMRMRYVLNFWNDQLYHPTNLNSRCIVSIITCYYYFCKQSNKYKFIFIILTILNIIVAISTATRTNIVFLVLFLVVGYLVDKKLKIDAQIFRKIPLKKLAYVFIACILGSCLFALNKNKIVAYIEGSAMMNRILYENIIELSNGRLPRMLRVITELGNYPFGGMGGEYAHNMWLDCARTAGIIPFVLLILYTVFVIRTWLVYLKTDVSQDYKLFILLIYVGLICSFFIEPVIEGRPLNLFIFCFVNGMVNDYSKLSRLK